MKKQLQLPDLIILLFTMKLITEIFLENWTIFVIQKVLTYYKVNELKLKNNVLDKNTFESIPYSVIYQMDRMSTFTQMFNL